jgi:hypothetical protein
MPDQNDVSWPLYFLWFTILKTNVVTSIDTASEKWAKATILNTIIQWWTTIVLLLKCWFFVYLLWWDWYIYGCLLCCLRWLFCCGV